MNRHSLGASDLTLYRINGEADDFPIYTEKFDNFPVTVISNRNPEQFPLDKCIRWAEVIPGFDALDGNDQEEAKTAVVELFTEAEMNDVMRFLNQHVPGKFWATQEEFPLPGVCFGISRVLGCSSWHAYEASDNTFTPFPFSVAVCWNKADWHERKDGEARPNTCTTSPFLDN